MRFIHLGDLHLGKIVNEFNMLEDQKYILDQILDLAAERKADAVLIAGDVYDKSIPSEEAVGLLDSFLCALTALGCRVLMISGNHDSEERLNFGSRLLISGGLYVAGKYEGQVREVCLEDRYGPVHFWLLPFVKASTVRHYHPDREIPDYDAAVRLALEETAPDPGARNVLVAHQFVTAGGADPVHGGSENMRPETVGAVEKVGSSAFDRFDYAALGHIHTPQRVGREAVRYSGSPLKYSRSEIRTDKSVPLVTLGEKGQVEIELVPLRPLREMRELKGPVSRLLAAENITDTEDYIFVTLTDEIPIPDAMDRMRAYYPNTMHLEYDNARTRAAAMAEVDLAGRERSFEELIREFYRMLDGTEMEEEDWQILSEAARRAGVIE